LFDCSKDGNGSNFEPTGFGIHEGWGMRCIIKLLGLFEYSNTRDDFYFALNAQK